MRRAVVGGEGLTWKVGGFTRPHRSFALVLDGMALAGWLVVLSGLLGWWHGWFVVLGR